MDPIISLIDENDTIKGFATKSEVHEKGLLHRAFSIFVMNDKDELLLQKRAADKYHSASLWTNTCCSHAVPGESLQTTAYIRLKEEMGFQCNLRWLFSFRYRAELDNGLIENELDHVFFGFFDGIPIINPKEASAFKWMPFDAIKNDIAKNPLNYTVWFRLIFDNFIEHFDKSKEHCNNCPIL